MDTDNYFTELEEGYGALPVEILPEIKEKISNAEDVAAALDTIREHYNEVAELLDKKQK